MADPAPSPYVGPRPFEAEDSDRFFGRDQEIRQLASLVIARRVVLLYARSGAGKTSLLKAGLVPHLERRKRFRVLPVFRVEDLVDLSLADEMASFMAPAADEERPRRALLIVDQFEELFTRYDPDGGGKEKLFLELQKSLEKCPRLSLVLSMREDYVAWLDSYAALLPDRLRTRYRLDLLGEDKARLAVREPARLRGLEFTEEAAQALVDDLRRVRVQKPDGSSEERLGDYVEPVQLQVVCRRLWQRVAGVRQRIEPSDVEAVGSVDRALADYYSECTAKVGAETGVGERKIRDWIESELITAQGLREQVLKAPETTAGLGDRAIQALVDAHLLRAEERRGVTWFELAHDRLVGPLRQDNAAWREEHLSEVERLAALWDSRERPPRLLLNGDALLEAERWAAEHAGELTPLESEFMTASAQARAQRRTKWMALMICAIVLAAAIPFAAVSHIKEQAATKQSIEAAEQRDIAEQQRLIAEQQRHIAEQQRIEADNQRIEADNQRNEAVKQREIADKQRKIADNQRKIANNLLRINLDVLGRLQTIGNGLEKLDAPSLRVICLSGSLYGLAKKVLESCDLAVRKAQNLPKKQQLANSRYYRGLARALTGDYDGAKADLEYCLDFLGDGFPKLSALLEEWIDKLAHNENPFNQATLNNLDLPGD